MEVDEFLREFDLMLEKDLEYTLAIYAEDRIIGTGRLCEINQKTHPLRL